MLDRSRNLHFHLLVHLLPNGLPVQQQQHGHDQGNPPDDEDEEEHVYGEVCDCVYFHYFYAALLLVQGQFFAYLDLEVTFV